MGRHRQGALVVCFAFGVLPAVAQISANGQSLTVTTTNAVATFAGPDLVGYRNLATNESYLKSPTAGSLAWVDMMTATGQGLQPSNWSVGTDPASGSPAATITLQDSVRSLSLQVRIDGGSQEIVITMSAHSSSPGLRGADWGIAGLDLGTGRLIVPALSGISYDAAHPGVGTYLEYPYGWHAQMVVYEAAAGSFVLYSTDQQYAFKQLQTSSRGNSTLDVIIGTEAVAPFPSSTNVPTVEWRLKAFAGNWRVAAQVYKDWLATNRPPVSNAAYSWVQNIRAVASIRPIDSSMIDSLATILVPSQTLLYVIDWRQEPYDYNYPDYTPGPGVAAMVSHAHALGFKVMLHTDMIGVTPTNADYLGVSSYQIKEPDSMKTIGWNWNGPASNPYRFAWINPASSAYRSLFINRLSAAVGALHPDALHLDVSAPMFNDGNGLIEGMTYPQGAVQLHKDVMAAFPGVVLGGEGENDILYPYEFYAQAWSADAIPAQVGHPIAAFLFSPQVKYYGHLGQPDASDPAFKGYLNDLETRAIVPQLPIFTSADLDQTNADNARLFALLQSWQSHAFQNDWTATGGAALAGYKGAGGVTATFLDVDGQASLTAAGAVLYRQIHDSNVLPTSSYISNWPAFDSTSLYGLDSTVRYWADSSGRPEATHVPSVPVGLQLGTHTMIAPGFAHVEVLQPTVAPFNFLGGFFNARLGINYLNADWPLGNGALAQETSMTSGGVARPAIVTHPPYLAQVGGETYVEYALPVPAGATLQFSAGMDDNATCTDGVTLRITANGTEIWRKGITLGGWQDSSASLAQYAGSTVALRLLSNPGPRNDTSCDRSGWSNLQLVNNPPPVSVSVALALIGGAVYSGFSGDGAASLVATRSPAISNLPAPGQFTIFTEPGQSVFSGLNLATLPFEVWDAGPGELPQPGGVFGAGTVQTATVGGVTKNLSIFAHPPNGGYAIFSWVLNLASNTTLTLGWNAGIDDNAPTVDGVQFLVYVNGVQTWTWTTAGHQWQPGSLDLSPWAGQNVLLQFVTYSLASNSWDHAEWADLMLTMNLRLTGGSSPRLLASNTHNGSFTQGQPGAVYLVTVSNSPSAVSTSGPVTVTEAVPAGLTLAGMSGANWTCTGNTCHRDDTLVAGAAYEPIQVAVNVADAAPPLVTNQVTVQGGGSTTTTASDFTSIAVFTCDLNGDHSTNTGDVLSIVGEALGTASVLHDLNHDGVVNITDAQKLINAALGQGCKY